MEKTITLRVDQPIYKAFIERANVEKRSLSKFIEMAVLQYVREVDFADEEEMDEILSNHVLLKRLKAGSREAGRRKGKLVA